MANTGPITTRNLNLDTGERVHEEDVMDQVFDLEPDETPVVATIPRGSAGWRDLTWIVKFDLPQRQVDTTDLGQTSAAPYDNIVKEADPLWHKERVQWSQRKRLETYPENFRYDLEVGGLASAVDPIGVQDEYALQVQDGSRQIARDLELRILEDSFLLTTVTGVVGQNTDPNRMLPLTELVANGLVSASNLTYTPNRFSAEDLSVLAPSTAAANAQNTAWDGSGITVNTPVSEEMFNKVMEKMAGHKYDPGISPDTVAVTAGPFGQLGGFGTLPSGAFGALSKNMDASMAKVVRVLQFYQTQFGIITVIWTKWADQATNSGTANTFNRDTNKGLAFFYARKFLQLAFIRNFHHEPLPPQGDHTIGMILGEVALKLLHPKAAAVVFGINNVPY